jgi:hypothetical protein
LGAGDFANTKQQHTHPVAIARIAHHSASTHHCAAPVCCRQQTLEEMATNPQLQQKAMQQDEQVRWTINTFVEGPTCAAACRMLVAVCKETVRF